MEKVGFFPRLIAFIIDGIIVDVVAVVILGFFGFYLFLTADTGLVSVPFTPKHGIGVAVAALWWMVYYLFFWSNTGQTPGKMIIGIEVISADDGGRIGVPKAIVRLFGYFIDFVVLGLGFLWIIWDRDKQGWHDKFARTYVVKKDR